MNAVAELRVESPPPIGDEVYASRTLPFSYRALGTLMAAGDLAIIEVSSVVTGVGYHLATLGSVGDVQVFVGTGLVVGYIFVSLMYAARFYRSSDIVGARPRCRQPVIAWLATFLGLAGIAFVLHIGASFSRGAILSFMAMGLAGLLVFRTTMSVAIKRALADGSLKGMHIVLIGHSGALADIDHVRNLRRFGYRVVHHLVMPDASESDEEATAQSLVADVLAFARENRVDEIVLGLRWSSLQLIDQVSVGLSRLPLPVRLLPDGAVRHLIHLPTSDFGASIALELQRGPLGTYQRVVKRSFDLLVAFFGVVAASPLLLITALIVKLNSPGPVFFRQRRTGYSGRAFWIFKFRTMRVLEDGAVVPQARRNDDRVTWSGRWMRRTSIDELPQLLNVLAGDMSLVGPRPHALAHDEEYDRLIDDYGLRFRVKPGITGWAQVNGFRGETATVDLMMSRVECDLWYISNWSLWLDVRTILKTVSAQLKASNAY